MVETDYSLVRWRLELFLLNLWFGCNDRYTFFDDDFGTHLCVQTPARLLCLEADKLASDFLGVGLLAIH